MSTLHKPRITMIGTGYVGLVSGTCFAEMGFNVTCVDIDAEKIRKLTEDAIIPIFEPGLEAIVKKNVEAGRLTFTTDLATCVPESDAVFIAVGTPQDEDGSADMKYVLQAAADIAAHLSGYTVIVDKSTVPVGTGAHVYSRIKEVAPEADFDVCSNPEFLREGEALADFTKPDRIVIGCQNERSLEVMRAIYAPQTNQGFPLLATDLETAELIKYAANAFLAAKITFINEMAALCEVVGADVTKVSEGLGLDDRIGKRFLQVGPGYGGSCFPKDTHALAYQGREHGCPQSLIEQTIASNEAIKKRMAAKVQNAWGGSLNGVTIAVLGYAFKANTDDMRDAPALTILPELEKMGAKLQAYDPEAAEQALLRMPSLNCVDSLDAAIDGADIMLILTEWSEFQIMDVPHLTSQLSKPIIVDMRNLFSLSDMEDMGVKYHSIGRKATHTTRNIESVA